MKPNTRFVPALILLSVVFVLFSAAVGCNTTQQRTAFNTLAASEATATATMDGVAFAAIKGLVSTNDLKTVSGAYDKFQAGFLVAIDLAQNNSNALAPDSLNQELSDLVSAAAVLIPTNQPPTPKPIK